VNRRAAIDLLDRLHRVQNKFYAGGSGSSFPRILAPSITWIIPGNNGIAGTYHGLEELLDYFRRRDLSDHTLQLRRREVLGRARCPKTRVRHPCWVSSQTLAQGAP